MTGSISKSARAGRRRLAGAAVVAAGLSVLGAACGANSGGEVRTATPTELNAGYLSHVADQSTAARTGRFDITVDLGGAGAGNGPDEAFTATATGAFDTGAGTYHQSMTMKLMGDDTKVEMVGTATAVYERGTLLGKIGGTGDKWLKFDFAALDPTGGAPGGPGSADPTSLLDYLRGTGSEIEDRGTETIDGVAVRHVHTTATINDIGNRLSDERKQKLAKALGSSSGAGSALGMLDAPVALDVFIGPDDLVRRLVVDIDTKAFAASSSTTSLKETVDYRDYGTAVNIVVPADEDTVNGFDSTVRVPGAGGGSTTTTTR